MILTGTFFRGPRLLEVAEEGSGLKLSVVQGGLFMRDEVDAVGG